MIQELRTAVQSNSIFKSLLDDVLTTTVEELEETIDQLAHANIYNPEKRDLYLIQYGRLQAIKLLQQQLIEV